MAYSAGFIVCTLESARKAGSPVRSSGLVGVGYSVFKWPQIASYGVGQLRQECGLLCQRPGHGGLGAKLAGQSVQLIAVALEPVRDRPQGGGRPLLLRQLLAGAFDDHHCGSIPSRFDNLTKRSKACREILSHGFACG